MSWSEQALGLVETRGLVGAIEAADAGLKSADVHFGGTERADAGLVTVMFTGETAAVQAAVAAAATAAERVGHLVSAHVIPRPHTDLDRLENEEEEAGDAWPPVPMQGNRYDVERLARTRVVELRAMARRIPGFPIRGREVARAGRDELLAAFRTLNA